jgi:hypothetical protein
MTSFLVIFGVVLVMVIAMACGVGIVVTSDDRRSQLSGRPVLAETENSVSGALRLQGLAANGRFRRRGSATKREWAGLELKR